MEIVRSGVLEAGRVLVPGCGIGCDAIFLAARGWEVVAFDFSVNAIEKAKLKVKSKGKLQESLRFEVERIEPVIMYRKGPPPDGLRLLARKRD